jgi:phosphate-selective porin
MALVLAACVKARSETAGLEERVRELEARVAEPEPGSVDVFYEDGLTFTEHDGDWSVVLGAYAIVRGDFFIRARERDHVHTFVVEDTAVHLQATLADSWEGYVHARFLPDGADLYLGHVGFVKWEALQVRAGVVTPPFSMEYDEWVQWIDLPYYSLTSAMDPDVSLGAVASGVLAEGAFDWSIGAFNGNGPGQNGDENSDKDVVARVRVRLEETPAGFLQFGVAASAGRARKDPGVTPFDFVMLSTGTTWHSDPGLVDYRTDGRVLRLQAQAAWILGPFELKSEAATFRAHVDFPDSRNHVFRAWSAYLSAGLWIGGSRRPGAVPTVDKPLFGGGVGAFQVVVRASRTVLDDTFAHHAEFAGARRVFEGAIALNWYASRHFRLTLMAAGIRYSSGRAVLDGGTEAKRENVLGFRAQVDF